jgi:hypothetical protein
VESFSAKGTSLAADVAGLGRASPIEPTPKECAKE